MWSRESGLVVLLQKSSNEGRSQERYTIYRVGCDKHLNNTLVLEMRLAKLDM